VQYKFTYLLNEIFAGIYIRCCVCRWSVVFHQFNAVPDADSHPSELWHRRHW